MFAGVGLTLFPASARDLAMDCSCPDVAVPCKHLAAVFYVLAERFDADPFEILALRGRDRETLLAELRARRAAAAGAGGRRRRRAARRAGPVLRRARAPAPGPSAGALAGPPTPPDALLDQVPEFPVAVRGRRVTELLRPAYRALAGE